MKKLALFALGMTTASLAFGQQSVAAYTTLEEPHAKQLFERFEKDTGIKVNWQRLAGGEVERTVVAIAGRSLLVPGVADAAAAGAHDIDE